MRRRDFVALIGGVVAWSPAASAQQSAMALVGLLSGTQLDDRLMEAVRQGLKDAGYIEGRNVAIKHRSADGRFDRLPTLAAELVADPVAVIVALPSPTAALAAKAATTTIPVVFATGADPIELGLVTSLNRRRQRHGRDVFYQRPRGKTVGIAARAGPERHCYRLPHQRRKSHY